MAKPSIQLVPTVTPLADTVASVMLFVEECRNRRRAIDEVSSKRGSLPTDLHAARLRRDNARAQAERQRAAANARRIAKVEYDGEPLLQAEQALDLADAEVKRLEDLTTGIQGAVELLVEDLDAAHNNLNAAVRPIRDQLQAQAAEKYRRALADLRDAVELVRAMNGHIADSDILLPPIDRDAPSFQFSKPSADVAAVAEAVRPIFWEEHRSLQRLLRN